MKLTKIELIKNQKQAAETLMAVVESAYQVQCKQLPLLTGNDKEAALEARDAIWNSIYPMFQQMYELADSWNSLTYRTADTSF